MEEGKEMDLSDKLKSKILNEGLIDLFDVKLALVEKVFNYYSNEYDSIEMVFRVAIGWRTELFKYQHTLHRNGPPLSYLLQDGCRQAIAYALKEAIKEKESRCK